MTNAHTAPLALKGEKGGEQKSIAGDEVLKSKPDPLVKERAHDLAKVLDDIAVLRDRLKERKGSLIEAFKKSKKARNVKVTTEHQTYYFDLSMVEKLDIDKVVER